MKQSLLDGGYRLKLAYMLKAGRVKSRTISQKKGKAIPESQNLQTDCGSTEFL